jgi:hypothetical protein
VRWIAVAGTLFAGVLVGVRARMTVLNRSAVGLAAALAIVVGAPVAAQADDPPAPSVTTLEVTNIGGATATFHAKVNPNATVTTGYFVYGTAPDKLTQRTPDAAIGSGSGEIGMDAPVGQLSVNTKYYVVAVVENEDWIVTGDLVSFSTLAPPEIIGGSVSDITYKSATLHLNVAMHGQPVTVSGSVRSDVRIVLGTGSNHSSSSVVTPFGPYSVAADGDVAIPLPALDAATTYNWSAKVTSVVGEGTSGGTFRTESLIVMPRPTLTPAVATYGSDVTISGTIPTKPGLVLTLAAQPYPFNGAIESVAAMTTTSDATGAYAFGVRAERPVAYGVTADGAAVLAAGNVTKLKVAPAVTAKAKRARRHRFVVAGRYRPAIAGKVTLYRRGAGRVGIARTSKGTFRFPARALKPGKYEVRVTPAESTGFERAKSAAVIVPRR